MKKLLFLLSIIACFSGNAQHIISTPTPQGYWNLNGNETGASNWLGSNNAQPLVFKTNNAERFRIGSTGTFSFNNYAVNFGTGGNVLYSTSTPTNSWGINGNALGTNTLFIGSTDNRSMIFKTNNLQRFKIDSLGMLIMGTPSYTDANVFSYFQTNSNNYSQSIWQNTNSGNTASSDLIVSNNLGTKSTYYGDFGMNSSGYTGSSIFNKPNAIYLYGQDGDLAIGTTSTSSFYIGTNGVSRFKLDSIGNIKATGSFSIDQSGGINSASPKKFSFQPYTGDNTLPALYMAQNIPSATNYLVVDLDSTTRLINSPNVFIFKSGGNTFLQSQYTFTSAGSSTSFLAINTPTMAANAEFRHFTISGNTTGWATGTTNTQREILFTAPTYSANSSATITNAITLDVTQPNTGTNMTITNKFAARFTGNFNVTANTYFGNTAITPSAIAHFAAGSSTLPAMKFTSQTAPSSPNAGEFWYNSTLGFQHQGNIWASGNGSVIGTFSVGSTATVGAGLRCVGALSVTTTFSAGTTSTLAGNTRIGSSTAPINALSVTGAIDASTTFSCGTTATLVGATRIGSTTAPSATLDVTGTASISSTFSLGARLVQPQGAAVASVSGSITVGTDGNAFEITGTNAITLIDKTGFKDGSIIRLMFTSTATLTDGTANATNGIGMELAGNANFVATADDVVTLILCTVGGTQRWREVGRSVN